MRLSFGGVDDQIPNHEENHCICESRNYSTFMICCDYCDIWYHGVCVQVTRSMADRIEKYSCPLCMSADFRNITVYKATVANKKTSSRNKLGSKRNTPRKATYKKQPDFQTPEKLDEMGEYANSSPCNNLIISGSVNNIFDEKYSDGELMMQTNFRIAELQVRLRSWLLPIDFDNFTTTANNNTDALDLSPKFLEDEQEKEGNEDYVNEHVESDKSSDDNQQRDTSDDDNVDDPLFSPSSLNGKCIQGAINNYLADFRERNGCAARLVEFLMQDNDADDEGGESSAEATASRKENTQRNDLKGLLNSAGVNRSNEMSPEKRLNHRIALHIPETPEEKLRGRRSFHSRRHSNSDNATPVSDEPLFGYENKIANEDDDEVVPQTPIGKIRREHFNRRSRLEGLCSEISSQENALNASGRSASQTRKRPISQPLLQTAKRSLFR